MNALCAIVCVPVIVFVLIAVVLVWRDFQKRTPNIPRLSAENEPAAKSDDTPVLAMHPARSLSDDDLATRERIWWGVWHRRPADEQREWMN